MHIKDLSQCTARYLELEIIVLIGDSEFIPKSVNDLDSEFEDFLLVFSSSTPPRKSAQGVLSSSFSWKSANFPRKIKRI